MIKGEKAILRPIQKSDLSYLNEWKNNENIYMFLGGGFMPISIDQHEQWLESIIDNSGNNKRFMICSNEKSPIGMVGLYDINWIHRTCEIGIFIGNFDCQGKGLGKEACVLIEQFAKDYLNLRKIRLYVVEDNQIAFSMWKSLGYQQVGELIKERYIKGIYRNLIIMEKFIQ